MLETFEIFWFWILMYAGQFGLMAAAHLLNESRTPKNYWDLFEMTCMPLSIWRLKKYKI